MQNRTQTYRKVAMPSAMFSPSHCNIPQEVLDYEARVNRITALRLWLPRRLWWLTSPLQGKLANLRSTSLEAAQDSHEAALYRHERVCHEGGDSMVNGLVP
ncbi:hypothetical protein I8H89_02265 [Candidatus Saccharibacteria bacterium]|nr:hypothetical protein [Candidatus Saccharibacteria bacterium]